MIYLGPGPRSGLMGRLPPNHEPAARAGSAAEFDLTKIVDNLERPIADAHGLPRDAYVSPELYAREQSAVFGRGWIAAAFSHEIPEPGDAIPVDIAGIPLILVRNRKGEVCAFLNVCRHRGARLLDSPVRRRKAFTCPYHAWTYGLDGRLNRAPLLDGTRMPVLTSRQSCDMGLVAFACSTWLDMIFVDLSGVAGPLERHIGPLRPFWDIYAVERLKLFHYETGAIAGNWKLAIEAAIDTYHEGFVHRSLAHRVGRDGLRTFDDVGDGALFGIVWAGETSLRSPTPLAPLKPGVDETERIDSLCFLFPNAQFNMFGGLSVRTVWVPLAPDLTEWRSSWYIIDDWAEGESHSGTRDAIIGNWLEIREEDRQVIETMQAGRRSPITPAVVFAPFWEQTTLRFQRMWADALVYGTTPCTAQSSSESVAAWTASEEVKRAR